MSEPICTCHCGGSMFYRHMHAESCELSRVGEEAPKSELEQLREDVARLKKENEQLMEDMMKIRDHALDHFEFIEAVQSPPAALTPQAGKGGGA